MASLEEIGGILRPEEQIFLMVAYSDDAAWKDGEEWMLDISGDLREDRESKNPSGTE